MNLCSLYTFVPVRIPASDWTAVSHWQTAADSASPSACWSPLSHDSRHLPVQQNQSWGLITPLPAGSYVYKHTQDIITLACTPWKYMGVQLMMIDDYGGGGIGHPYHPSQNFRPILEITLLAWPGKHASKPPYYNSGPCPYLALYIKPHIANSFCPSSSFPKIGCENASFPPPHPLPVHTYFRVVMLDRWSPTSFTVFCRDTWRRDQTILTGYTILYMCTCTLLITSPLITKKKHYFFLSTSAWYLFCH